MSVVFRIASDSDLDAIVALLADDEIERTRRGFTETALPEVRAAFTAIQCDPDDDVWVGDSGGDIVATIQLTILNGLSRGGMRRALINGVRVRSDLRGNGIGKQMLQMVIDRARECGCGFVQISTDSRRVNAHRFYEGLGFEATHVGLNRRL